MRKKSNAVSQVVIEFANRRLVEQRLDFLE